MLNILKSISLLFVSLVIFSGCYMQQPQSGANNYVNPQSLDLAINSIADQLKLDTTLDLATNKGTIAVTSLVDLNSLGKTTQFGRIVGESMISELFKRGFNVSEFRGQGAISVNRYGEFYITRDVNKLSEIPNSYIMVGTYAQIENKTLLNIRIIDNRTGRLVASARQIYNQNYCVLSDNCRRRRIIKIVADNEFVTPRRYLIK
jgi:TolB-like protein